jgi:type III pantothenate kinase
MILCIDIGNTQIHAGVFENKTIKLQFRKSSRGQFSSDEIGVFMRTTLRENNIDPTSIKDISICSVVPDLLHSMVNGCLKYFNINPFVLKPGVKTGLKIKYRNPLEVGTDRIANAIAAIKLFADKNIIVVDFGTATTFDVITKNREYLGGIIFPGFRLSMESLNKNTAQLPNVEIFKPQNVVGRSTEESIRSGLYFGQKAILKTLRDQIVKESFSDNDFAMIATGGFSSLFENENIFDAIIPDLVLIGLLEALEMNNEIRGKNV